MRLTKKERDYLMAWYRKHPEMQTKCSPLSGMSQEDLAELLAISKRENTRETVVRYDSYLSIEAHKILYDERNGFKS